LMSRRRVELCRYKQALSAINISKSNN